MATKASEPVICQATMNELCTLSERIWNAWNARARLLEKAAGQTVKAEVSAELRRMSVEAIKAAAPQQLQFMRDAKQQISNGVTLGEIREQARQQIRELTAKPAEVVPTAEDHLDQLRRRVAVFLNEVAKSKDASLFAGCLKILSGDFECDRPAISRLLDECKSAAVRLAEFIKLLESKSQN
jgi:arginine deiminase